MSERLNGLFGHSRLTGELGEVIYQEHGYSDPDGFVKLSRYEEQDEARMVWKVRGPEAYKPFLLYAPEVVPFCRRRTL